MITTTTIIGRAIISLLFVLAGHLLMRFGGKAYLKFMQISRKNTKWPDAVWGGHPTLLYFKTPECSVCKYQQEKIVDRVHQNYTGRGINLDLNKFDAAEEVEIANLFGVVTVPTTVVLDKKGEITALNTGIIKEKKLNGQVDEALAVRG